MKAYAFAVKVVKCFLFLFMFFCTLPVFAAKQSGTLKAATNGLDILVYNVNVFIKAHDGDSITYYSQTNGKTKISFVEHKKRFRVRSIYPVEGSVYINIPKKMLLESCRLHASYSSVDVTGIKAAYFTVAVSEGKIGVKDCVFKDAVFNIAKGTLSAESEIICAADICTSDSKAEVVFLGGLNDFNFYYAQGAFSGLTVNGKPQKEAHATLGNEKAKKRIRAVIGTSEAVFRFEDKNKAKKS